MLIARWNSAMFGDHLLDLVHREEAAERLLEVAADLLLIAREVLHAELEIARQERLQAVIVITDELAQEADRQEIATLPSSSRMICVSTERVMSSPVFASYTTKSSPLRTIWLSSSSVT